MIGERFSRTEWTYIVFTLVVLTLNSCNTKLSKTELKDWAMKRGNGFYHEKEINGYKFSCLLLPSELLKIPTQEQMADFRIVIGGLDEKLNVRRELENQYGEAVKRYFAFEVEKDIFLEVDGNTISPSFVHFEQGTDLSKNYQLLVSFDKKMPQDVKLIFEPKFPDLGKLKFKFKKELLMKKPALI